MKLSSIGDELIVNIGFLGTSRMEALRLLVKQFHDQEEIGMLVQKVGPQFLGPTKFKPIFFVFKSKSNTEQNTNRIKEF